MKYYSCEGIKLVPAPKVLPGENGGEPITAPEAADYARYNMYTLRPVVPESREGYMARISGYAVENGAWVPQYEYDPLPDPVVTYSKRKFMLACAAAGVFAGIKAWMESTEIVEGSGLTAWELLSQSHFLRTDDADFQALYAAAVSQYGEERVKAILAESVDYEA